MIVSPAVDGQERFGSSRTILINIHSMEIFDSLASSVPHCQHLHLVLPQLLIAHHWSILQTLLLLLDSQTYSLHTLNKGLLILQLYINGNLNKFPVNNFEF